MKAENKFITEEFKENLLKIVGNDVFFFKVYSGAFGISGHPDLQIKLPDLPHTFYVEVKDEKSYEKAFKHVLPSQKGFFRVLLRANAKVFLLWTTGVARMGVNEKGLFPKTIKQGDPVEKFLELCYEN